MTRIFADFTRCVNARMITHAVPFAVKPRDGWLQKRLRQRAGRSPARVIRLLLFAFLNVLPQELEHVFKLRLVLRIRLHNRLVGFEHGDGL